MLFVSGAVVMIYELVGTRVVAPYLGASTYVWTSIIGVVLASLSLGYWWGGRWADHHPALYKLAPVFGGAAGLVALTGWLSDWVRSWIGLFGLSLEMSAMVAAVGLFAPAATLLGVVSPYLTRLHVQSLTTVGRQLGTMAAFSTMGSIVGTFLAGFLLIPLLGTEKLLLCIAGVLALLGVVCAVVGRKWLLAAMIVVMVGGIAGLRQLLLASQQVVDVDTAYSRVQITRGTEQHTGRPVVQLATGSDEAQSAMFLDGDDYVFAYTRLMDVFSMVQPAPKKVLILGGAGYTMPRHLLRWESAPAVTVVEIDPGMTELARQHFGLVDDQRLVIKHTDARTFLTQATDQYDVIMIDVFSHGYGIPFHILTKESLSEFHRRLAPDGVIVTNVIGAPQGERDGLVGSVVKTFQTQFNQIELLSVYPEHLTHLQNVIIVATDVPLTTDWLADSIYVPQRLSQLPLGGRVLTDDYAPMEALVRAQW